MSEIETPSISKLRALHCLDSLLKNQKYFTFIKTYKEDIFRISFNAVKDNEP